MDERETNEGLAASHRFFFSPPSFLSLCAIVRQIDDVLWKHYLFCLVPHCFVCLISGKVAISIVMTGEKDEPKVAYIRRCHTHCCSSMLTHRWNVCEQAIIVLNILDKGFTDKLNVRFWFERTSDLNFNHSELLFPEILAYRMNISQQTGSNYQLTSAQVSSNLPESTKNSKKR